MYWSLVVIGILVMICIILGIKLILVNRTAKSIQSQLENWLMTDTNTLIDVSHRDKTMCGLAKCLNIELQKLREIGRAHV